MKPNNKFSLMRKNWKFRANELLRIMNLAGLIIFFISGCSQDLINSPSNDPAFKAAQEDSPNIGDIYIAGMNEKSAVYWKNDSIYRLEVESEFSHAEDIVVVNKDIFVVGMDGQKPCLWKNGKKTWLDDRLNSIARSILVKNEIIYIAGSVYDQGMKGDRPVLWKNGQISYLAEAGEAFDVCAAGDDIFVNGLHGTDACYWKNGQQNLLAKSGNGSYSYSIANYQQDIFIPGFYVPKTENTVSNRGYWKNDKFFPMENSDVVLKFSFNNGVKYGVGSKNKKACLWIDNTPQILPGDLELEAKDICFHNDDVYVVGAKHDPNSMQDTAGYWKNGQWVVLGSANSFASAAVAVK